MSTMGKSNKTEGRLAVAGPEGGEGVMGKRVLMVIGFFSVGDENVLKLHKIEMLTQPCDLLKKIIFSVPFKGWNPLPSRFYLSMKLI